MLEVKDIVSGYSGVNVLQNVSVSVEEGEIVTVLGPNGAGKTTLARSIYGVITPVSGSIKFDGEELVGVPTYEIGKKGLSYAPQDKSIFRALTVEENLKMGAYLNEESYQERLEEITAIFPRLKERLNQTADTLSGGERQMLSLGIALMLEPDFLIVDEPSLGLQPTLVEEALNRINEINQTEGVTILMIEQSAPKALEISDKAYVLAAGEIIFEGTPQELEDTEELSDMYMIG